ncbi:MAG: DNA-processing protein DprA [Phycisphaerae bacterium]
MSTTITDTGRDHLLLAMCAGVGPIRFAAMVERFGGPAEAARASTNELCELKGVGRDTAEQIVRSRDAARVDAEIAAAEELGARIVCRADPEYPEGLRRIPDAPIVLYVKGELRPTDAISVAIVGSRRCTIYGSEQARRFGELLAQAGFTIVSGLARGIDAFAMHGAADVGGRAIAVMGNGLHEIYPPENRALAEKLLERGAWMSELPLQTAARAENFPSRNRIIAGITLGTLVVEAAQRSGALITARLATEYNREVFAVPGRVQDPMSFGTNGLIRDGAAKLVMTLEDVLDEFGELGRTLGRPTAAAETLFDSGAAASVGASAGSDAGLGVDGAADAGLSSVERRVLDAMGSEPVLVSDVVSRLSDVSSGEVLAAFTSLELRGLAARLPGQRVARRRRD